MQSQVFLYSNVDGLTHKREKEEQREKTGSNEISWCCVFVSLHFQMWEEDKRIN